MRPSLIAFSQAMEKRLAEFDQSKGEDGWKTAEPRALVNRARSKVSDLECDFAAYEEAQARKVPRQSLSEEREELLSSAADVANYVMMVVDQCHAMPLAQPSPTDIQNLRLRSTLEQARSLLAILGSPTDEVQQAMLQGIDDVLTRKPVATKSVVRAFAASLTSEDRQELLEVLQSDHDVLEGDDG